MKGLNTDGNQNHENQNHENKNILNLLAIVNPTLSSKCKLSELIERHQKKVSLTRLP
jgi:hypothetical protein